MTIPFETGNLDRSVRVERNSISVETCSCGRTRGRTLGRKDGRDQGRCKSRAGFAKERVAALDSGFREESSERDEL
ncbi:hypothetical protein CRG98_046350 [Punica granatum]|uniref:Uncharacterized protein n=1 Tax=Punica granatum TaxID=22663 RepID=A0A2I0HPR8_PUNGR|nr:hypothetical protein CRG98_046350 [Punica granatum]